MSLSVTSARWGRKAVRTRNSQISLARMSRQPGLIGLQTTPSVVEEYKSQGDRLTSSALGRILLVQKC